MESGIGGVLLVLVVVWMIALLVLYHKIFVVYYFDLGAAIGKELLYAFIGGLIMAGLTLYLWYVAAAIVVLLGLSIASKKHSLVPMVLCIIVAVVIAIAGITFKKDVDNKEGKSATSKVQIETISDDLIG